MSDDVVTPSAAERATLRAAAWEHGRTDTLGALDRLEIAERYLADGSPATLAELAALLVAGPGDTGPEAAIVAAACAPLHTAAAGEVRELAAADAARLAREVAELARTRRDLYRSPRDEL